MTDRNAFLVDGLIPVGAGATILDHAAYAAVPTDGSVNYRYFLMRARDLNSPGPNPTWRTWVVAGEADYSVTQYTGAYDGGSINFGDVNVAASWTKPYPYLP